MDVNYYRPLPFASPGQHYVLTIVHIGGLTMERHDTHSFHLDAHRPGGLDDRPGMVACATSQSTPRAGAPIDQTLQLRVHTSLMNAAGVHGTR